MGRYWSRGQGLKIGTTVNLGPMPALRLPPQGMTQPSLTALGIQGLAWLTPDHQLHLWLGGASPHSPGE